MRYLLLAISLLSLSPAYAESFMPKNNLHLKDNIHMLASMDEKQFNGIVDKVISAYSSYATAFGATLVGDKLWTDTTVNAYAEQVGKQWIVHMYGGLARRPEITPDGFAMVVCHELGHHFGGFSFFSDYDWAAAEGQADYFAMHACAKKIWGSEKAENQKFRDKVPTTAKQKCDQVYSNTDDQNLCYRTSAAGMSLASLLAALESGPVPSFDTPDQSQVTETFTDHPAAQCRLDTYFNASLCSAQFDSRVIPGKGITKGQTSIEAEQDSAKYTCTKTAGYRDGMRSLCWFKPRL